MYKYYIFWWATTSTGFANGAIDVNSEVPITDPSTVEDIQEWLRKEVDRPTATIMNWSKFEDPE